MTLVWNLNSDHRLVCDVPKKMDQNTDTFVSVDAKYKISTS
jgi:hypothetical protein